MDHVDPTGRTAAEQADRSLLVERLSKMSEAEVAGYCDGVLARHGYDRLAHRAELEAERQGAEKQWAEKLRAEDGLRLCRYGHEMTAENSLTYVAKTGAHAGKTVTTCRACKAVRRRSQNVKEKQKAAAVLREERARRAG